MKTLMINRMNEEKRLQGEILDVIKKGLDPDLADLKANEIMRIFGYSYNRMSADDLCPYCNSMKGENGECLC